jgi:hypothetical protein
LTLHLPAKILLYQLLLVLWIKPLFSGRLRDSSSTLW